MLLIYFIPLLCGIPYNTALYRDLDAPCISIDHHHISVHLHRPYTYPYARLPKTFYIRPLFPAAYSLGIDNIPIFRYISL